MSTWLWEFRGSLSYQTLSEFPDQPCKCHRRQGIIFVIINLSFFTHCYQTYIFFIHWESKSILFTHWYHKSICFHPLLSHTYLLSPIEKPLLRKHTCSASRKRFSDISALRGAPVYIEGGIIVNNKIWDYLESVFWPGLF